jgi:hypothetical protein
MRPQDIKLGEFYRFKEHPNYGYAKAMEICNPKHRDNPHSYIIIKCEHTIGKNDTCGFIRYFRPCDLVKDIK